MDKKINLQRMTIRKTLWEDIDAVMPLYSIAREYMRRNGNTTQWTGGYPSRSSIEQDVTNGNSFLAENDNGQVCFVFSFIIGEEPTYKVIEHGQWLNQAPYGTVHRIASAGIVKGVFDSCIAFCKTFGVDIRIDTHKDNAKMLHAIAKNGFVHCGIICIADGTERIAFQLLRS
jgi:hypothetical protein